MFNEHEEFYRLMSCYTQDGLYVKTVIMQTKKGNFVLTYDDGSSIVIHKYENSWKAHTLDECKVCGIEI